MLLWGQGKLGAGGLIPVGEQGRRMGWECWSWGFDGSTGVFWIKEEKGLVGRARSKSSGTKIRSSGRQEVGAGKGAGERDEDTIRTLDWAKGLGFTQRPGVALQGRETGW